jgi:hypothetical protein
MTTALSANDYGRREREHNEFALLVQLLPPRAMGSTAGLQSPFTLLPVNLPLPWPFSPAVTPGHPTPSPPLPKP